MHAYRQVDTCQQSLYGHQPKLLGKDETLLDLARPFGIFVILQSLSNDRETQDFQLEI
jgi:hypothetical protein